MSAGPRLKWLEISPDYRCNNRCLGCFTGTASFQKTIPFHIQLLFIQVIFLIVLIFF